MTIIKNTSTITKPYLKWVGGKRKQAQQIVRYLPEGKRLVVPFAGALAVTLQTDYPSYLISDLNSDLIRCHYDTVNKLDEVIDYANKLFKNGNTRIKFEQTRRLFNKRIVSRHQSSALFVYLNRFGFNGLCRYNKSGNFNTPFGRYKNPLVPKKNMGAFKEFFSGKEVNFIVNHWEVIFELLEPGDVVYCDPPYLPDNHSTFTAYNATSFGEEQHEKLNKEAIRASQKGVKVFISNRDCIETRNIYRNDFTELHNISGTTSVSSAHDGRKKIVDLLIEYK